LNFLDAKKNSSTEHFRNLLDFSFADFVVPPQLAHAIFLIINLENGRIVSVDRRLRLLVFVAKTSRDGFGEWYVIDFEQIGTWHTTIRNVLIA